MCDRACARASVSFDIYVNLSIVSIRTRGEMDITTVFGTVIGGSNPSGCTERKTQTAWVFRYLGKISDKIPQELTSSCESY